jgi:N-acylglucosamine-6-phosphate 2-epimerase
VNRTDFAATIRSRLIVSCQAPADHPMRDTQTLVRVAAAAAAGGAAAIRCGGVGGAADVAAIRATVDIPIIGLTKDGTHGVYLTPTLAAVRSVIAAGADVIATDATSRARPDGATLADTVEAVHAVGRLVMADVSTTAEGVAAATAGADMIATTLSGYTDGDPPPDGPDLALVTELRTALPDALLIAEGRYHSPAQARAAILAGADAVAVGTAITDPQWITTTFTATLKTAFRPGDAPCR